MLLVEYHNVNDMASAVRWKPLLYADDSALKLKFTQYPAIHSNYSLSNYTISNQKDCNRSSDILVIN